MAEDWDLPTERMKRGGDEPAGVSGDQAFGEPARTIRAGGDDFGGFVGGVSADKTMILDARPPMFAWLAITSGPHRGRLCQMRGSGTSIGRAAQNDIMLGDDAVSELHAKVRMEKVKNQEGEEEDRFFIWDLASTNGTFVNGERIVKQVLRDGDEVRIGTTTLVFKKV